MDNLILNAEALLKIADIISAYCKEQQETIDDYYSDILSLESEWRDDETFGAIVEEIKILRANVTVIIDEINATYPRYFREKAQYISERPSMEAGAAIPAAEISHIPSGSFSAPKTSSHTEENIPQPDAFKPFTVTPEKYHDVETASYKRINNLRQISEKMPKAVLDEKDIVAFKDGQYETIRLREPLTVYRYFGSYTPGRMTDIVGKKAVWAAESELTNIDEQGWGSDAGGRWLSLNPDLTPEEATEFLALNPDWGNSVDYITEITLPKGTEISIGIAGKQKSGSGKILCGGEVQIFVSEWNDNDTKSRINKCVPINRVLNKKNKNRM